MSFITRDDGERFVVPSYRDVIAAKNPSVLKKEIQNLSGNYGEYITLQRKNPLQFEVAFSPDTGYLLGETVWHHFKRPFDLVYCEAIPNTTEAILVIVKDGSVYLDGRFPVEGISEELIIFLTQKSNFDIYIYGDVPISQQPDMGKFSFEENSVRTFTILQEPVFQTLPLLKIYQLQLAEQVLREQGIGVLPVKKIIVAGVIVVFVYVLWGYMTAQPTVVQQAIFQQADPYLGYIQVLSSPAPDVEINQVLDKVQLVLAMPGWAPISSDYSNGKMATRVKSNGTNVNTLANWASRNAFTYEVTEKGLTITSTIFAQNRPAPKKIIPLKQLLVNLIDRLAVIYPGDHIRFKSEAMGVYTVASIQIDFTGVSPNVLRLIAQEFANMPFVLQKMLVQYNDGLLAGSITIDAIGSPL